MGLAEVDGSGIDASASSVPLTAVMVVVAGRGRQECTGLREMSGA